MGVGRRLRSGLEWILGNGHSNQVTAVESETDLDEQVCVIEGLLGRHYVRCFVG